MKRSRTISVGGLMAAGSVSLTACAQGAADRVPAESPGSTGAWLYSDVPECRAKDEAPDSACDRAALNAVEDDARTAHWADRTRCEEAYGWGQCVAHERAGVGPLWGPLVVGFVVGRTPEGVWSGRGVYRDWQSCTYFTAEGGRLWTGYATGQMRIAVTNLVVSDAVRAPGRVRTLAPVVSRCGFGWRMSARGWGG